MSLPTEGHRIAVIAEALGKPLMPWQRHVADVSTERLPNGRYKYPIVLVTVPRQSGKTTLVGPVQLNRIMSTPRIKAFYTAQTGKDARSRFTDLVSLVQDSPVLSPMFKIRWAAGSEAIVSPNGSRLQTFAPGPAALHGETPPLVTLDEIWHHSEARGVELDGAIGPAQITIPTRQLWMISTMGTALSSYMNEWVRRGRAGEPGIAYFEWSLDPAADPYDPAAWGFHPALGITIEQDDLAAESKRQTRGEWLRAYCNRLTDTVDALIPADDFDALDTPAPPTRSGVALAYEVAADGQSAAVFAGWRTPDGLPAVHVVHHAAGTSWLAPMIRRLREEWRPVAVAADDGGVTRSITAELVAPPNGTAAPIEVDAVNARDFAAACHQWLAAARDDRTLQHCHSEALSRAVSHAVIRTAGDTWRFSRAHSTGSIAALIASLVAVWAFDRAAAPLPKPVVRF